MRVVPAGVLSWCLPAPAVYFLHGNRQMSSCKPLGVYKATSALEICAVLRTDLGNLFSFFDAQFS
jgi:hypothetical protein